ncbi:hypothetical protein PENTCL1PPCAC_21077, partial [Pristionchus entomophagus]
VVARALIPSCFLTVLLRAAITAMTLFAFLKNLFPVYMSYTTTYHCTINSVQFGLVVILIHQGMRIRAKSMILRCFRRGRVA